MEAARGQLVGWSGQLVLRMGAFLTTAVSSGEKLPHNNGPPSLVMSRGRLVSHTARTTGTRK